MLKKHMKALCLYLILDSSFMQKKIHVEKVIIVNTKH